MDKVASRIEKAVIAGLFILFVGLSLLRIHTERPYGDEAYFATPGLNLIRHGYMGASNIDPTNPIQIGIDRHSYWTVPLYFLMTAAWYKLVGFELFRARLLPLLFSVAGLVALYFAARKLTGSFRIGWLAAALTGLTFPYIWSAAINRMDSACLAFGIAGLAFYLWDRERNLDRAVFVSQALIAASGMTHPAGILYFVALAFLTLYYDRQRLNLRHVLIAGIPYVVGAVSWWMYLRQAPQEFVAQFTGSVKYHNLRIFSFSNLKAEILHRYLGYFGIYGAQGFARLRSVQLAAYITSILVIAFNPRIRKTQNAGLALMLLAIMCVGLTLTDGIKSWIYLVHVIPWFSLVLAIAAVRLAEAKVGGTAIAAAALSALVLIQLAGVVLIASRYSLRTIYLPAVAYIEANIPQSQAIFGSSELGFVLGFDRNLTDDPSLGFWSGKSPDVIVADTNWSIGHWGSRQPGDDQYQRIHKVLSNCQLSYHTDDYMIYRCPGH